MIDFFWLRIGFCLFNISEGDIDGLSLWLEFSEQSDKYHESECISLWNKMRENNYTIGTLKFYAKQDNPEKYEELINKEIENLVITTSGTHYEIANILFHEYQNEFVCTSIKNKEWYQFKNHIWEINETGFSLRKRISDENGIIIKKFKLQKEKILNNNFEDEKEKQKKIKFIDKLIASCQTTIFKNHVMSEAQELFFNENFNSLLNKNPHLIAFKNGVYDFNDLIFRNGNPDDYLSASLPIEYKIYHHTVEDVMNIENFFKTIFPDDELCEYFLNLICQVFVGGNPDKNIYFWTGSGDNGKTITQKLIELMLGNLAIKISTSLLTGKKSNLGSASPELCRASIGVRWAAMDEPNSDEIINAGILKNFTGNDSFFARDLFQKGKETREITPFFKLHLLCNQLPTIKNGDSASFKRIRIIPFESTFLPEEDEECPKTPEDQRRKKIFPMDKNFSNYLKNMTEPLAWYLIERYKTKNFEFQKEPNKVKMATQAYIRENDLYESFIQMNVEKRSKAKLYLNLLYLKFHSWILLEYPHQSIPTKQMVKKYFINKWGDLFQENKNDGGYWSHWCLKDED